LQGKIYQRVSCGESFSAIVLGIARLLDDHRAMRLVHGRFVHDPAARLVHDPGVHDPGARLVRDHGSRHFIAPAQDTRQVPPVPQKPGQNKIIISQSNRVELDFFHPVLGR
jgi:hypothetical protein